MTDITEFRGKSPDELKDMALTLKKELFNLRFQVVSGELANTARFRTVRRDIARIKTVLKEPKGAAAPVAKVAKAPKAKETKTTKAKKKA